MVTSTPFFWPVLHNRIRVRVLYNLSVVKKPY